jgi:hypothetical protein
MKTFAVKCDICGDAMQKQADVYACYPCKHMIYESELYLNDANVEVHVIGATKEEMNALGTDV